MQWYKLFLSFFGELFFRYLSTQVFEKTKRKQLKIYMGRAVSVEY